MNKELWIIQLGVRIGYKSFVIVHYSVLRYNPVGGEAERLADFFCAGSHS